MTEKKYGPNTAKVEAFLALLPKLTDEQWAAAREAGGDASWSFEWHVAADAALGAAEAAERIAEWDAAEVAVRPAAASRWRVAAAWAAAWGAAALVMRDLITPEQFDILTAPMRAAEIDFDALTTGSADPSPVRCTHEGGEWPGLDRCADCGQMLGSAELVKGDAKLPQNSGDADATENHADRSK